MDDKKFNKYDLRWMMSLFGTAVGAGILFLPIKAGAFGIYPVLVMTLLAFPMTFLSHRNLARFCNASKKPQSDISEVSEEFFGAKAGIIITFLYFFVFFQACIMYGVGITNTLISFMQNQLEIAQISRFAVCFIIISAMIFVMIFKEDLVIKVCEWLTYPLCALLLIFSLYLVPHWQISAFFNFPTPKDFFLSILFSLPVLAFSFEHTPAVSTFAQSMQRRYGNTLKDFKCNQILFKNATILLFFIMFFVISCVLSLNPDEFSEAAKQNIPIVSYFANKFDDVIISYFAPLIAILAIATSFFGHYFGVREGLNGIVNKTYLKFQAPLPKEKPLNIAIAAFFYITMLIFSYLNPSILGIIDMFVGPIIAAILFLLPVYGIYKVPALKKYRKISADIFIAVFGIFTIATVVFEILF